MFMKKLFLKSGFLAGVFITGSLASGAQTKTELITYGDMDRWIVREIKESAVIGGAIRHVYEIAPGDTIKNSDPYKPRAQSPWGCSNVMARVSGITKCSVTVFPEKRGDGMCARLDTRLEECKVLGIVNITVLASGSIFMGEMDEPVKDTKNPNSKLIMGIKFTQKPKALSMDYKLRASAENKRLKATGFSAQKEIPGRDYASVTVFLQKRWEDSEGRIFARRVGTGCDRLGQNTAEWIDNYQIPIRYGDITGDPAFKPYMDLTPEAGSYYCRNSKGKVVPIVETGWADAGETPTHIILLISSSYDSAYIGSVGNSLWVDNVKFAY